MAVRPESQLFSSLKRRVTYANAGKLIIAVCLFETSRALLVSMFGGADRRGCHWLSFDAGNGGGEDDDDTTRPTPSDDAFCTLSADFDGHL